MGLLLETIALWYVVVMVIHLFVGFCWYGAMSDARMYDGEELRFTPNELVIWCLLWPVCDSLVMARFLSKGFKQLWARL